MEDIKKITHKKAINIIKKNHGSIMIIIIIVLVIIATSKNDYEDEVILTQQDLYNIQDYIEKNDFNIDISDYIKCMDTSKKKCIDTLDIKEMLYDIREDEKEENNSNSDESIEDFCVGWGYTEKQNDDDNFEFSDGPQ